MRVFVNLFELLAVLAVVGIFLWLWIDKKLAARRERKLTERLQKAVIDKAKQ